MTVVALLFVWKNAVQLEIPFYTDTHSHNSLICPANPIVIVAFGQSLAANSGEHIYEPGPEKNLYVYYNGRCFDLADPILGATGKGGSIWSPVASRVASLIHMPIVIISGGVDGSTIAQWTAKHSPLSTPLRARIIDATRSGLRPNIFIWIQGEADAESKTSVDAYRVGLERLHRLFNGAPWLITSNSICSKMKSRSLVLDTARQEFARIVPDIYVAADFDNLGPEYRVSDHCHLNWLGQEQAGILVADEIAKILAR